MTVQSDPVSLAGDFPAASREQWRSLVSAVLSKAGVAADDPEAALTTLTYDGIELAALYTAHDVPASAVAGSPGASPFIRGAGRTPGGDSGWDVRALHADPDPARTNAAILNDLENGVTSLWLVLGDDAIAPADLPRVLDGVYLDLAPTVLDAGNGGRAAAEAFLALATERGVPAADLAGSLGLDPIGVRARTGVNANLAALAVAVTAARAFPQLRAITVDGSIYHEAGGSDSDELAVAAAVGLAYLRALDHRGIGVAEAAAAMEFRFATTADQFLSIAKFRAARRIWDRVGELAGVPEQVRGQRQHAVTSSAMMTRRDPWVNLLRTTIGCFAAAVGGADAVTVRPFDAAIGLPDDFARRIARNTQSILHDEASLARVIDPAGGSWYIETLTDRLAEVAWDKFTAIERVGGALGALDSGTLRELLAETHQRRRQNIAHRLDPITGVSEFALISEIPVQRPGAVASNPDAMLPTVRYAEDFEALRDRSDAHLAATGARPVVTLAALGNAASYSARVGFAANLFQAAGIEPLTVTGDDLSGNTSKVVCLCSSDRTYLEQAVDAAATLRRSGATRVLLAGAPAERGALDIDGYVFTGCDALKVLQETLDELEVA